MQESPVIKNAMQFHGFDLSEKRARLAQHIKAIMVGPVVIRGQRTIDLTRITIHWTDGTVDNLNDMDLYD